MIKCYDGFEWIDEREIVNDLLLLAAHVSEMTYFLSLSCASCCGWTNR